MTTKPNATAAMSANRTAAMKSEPNTAEKECKCSLRTRLVGDGCEVCNPDLAAELYAPECETCGTLLAFEGDECDLCEEEAQS